MNNELCEFVTQDNILFECKNCGLKVTATEPQQDHPNFVCQRSIIRQVNQDKPGFAQKVQNFAKATAQHISAGMPMCTEEQIIERHDICLKCEYFKNDTCTKCGCPLIRNKQFISKLAWADQECPVGKWKKIIN